MGILYPILLFSASLWDRYYLPLKKVTIFSRKPIFKNPSAWRIRLSIVRTTVVPTRSAMVTGVTYDEDEDGSGVGDGFTALLFCATVDSPKTSAVLVASSSSCALVPCTRLVFVVLVDVLVDVVLPPMPPVVVVDTAFGVGVDVGELDPPPPLLCARVIKV